MAGLTASILSQVLERVLMDPNNKIGGNLLGTYTDENNEIIASISIGNPGPIKHAEGLEVIIPLLPYSGGGGVDTSINSVERWDILLVQRNVAPLYSPKLPEAIHRLKALFAHLFNGQFSVQFVDSDTRLNSYPQATFTFYSDQFIDVRPLLNAYITGL